MRSCYLHERLDTARRRVHLGGMPNDDKPNPLDDAKKGLGLLFRAAKTVVQKLPTQPLEKVVIEGAREVGRAVENVTTTIEKQVFGRDKDQGDKSAEAKSEQPKDAADAAPPAPSPPQPIVTPPPEGEKKGARVE